MAKAARALNLADTTPTTLPRSSTNAPPELPGCTGTLIWKYRASSPAPDSNDSRLSSFFRDHFPQIKLASELEKDLAIQALAASLQFRDTHRAIARLAKYTQFTGAQLNDIVRAAVSNDQVWRIIKDEDVHKFLSSVIPGHEADIEAANLASLQGMLTKDQPNEGKTDGEDVAF